MRHKVLLVEPHPLLRDGLRALINAAPDFEVVAEAQDAVGAIGHASALRPDIVVSEIALAQRGGLDGLEALADIRRRCPDTLVVVLTSAASHGHLREALSLGVRAFVVKETSFDQVLTAMRSAVRGCTYLSPEVSGHVVQQYLNPGRVGEGTGQLDQLTRRERSIMRLIAEGRTNRDAAEVLHLSPKTIEKHRASVMRKLGLRSVAELAMLAVEARLIEPPSAVRRVAEGAALKAVW